VPCLAGSARITFSLPSFFCCGSSHSVPFLPPVYLPADIFAINPVPASFSVLLLLIGALASLRVTTPVISIGRPLGSAQRQRGSADVWCTAAFLKRTQVAFSG